MTKGPGEKELQVKALREARFDRNKATKKPSAAALRQQMAKVNKPNVRPTGRGR